MRDTLTACCRVVFSLRDSNYYTILYNVGLGADHREAALKSSPLRRSFCARPLHFYMSVE
jgi:hypothetical protein